MGNNAEMDASLIKLSMLALFSEMPSMDLHAVGIFRPGKVENGEVVAELCDNLCRLEGAIRKHQGHCAAQLRRGTVIGRPHSDVAGERALAQ